MWKTSLQPCVLVLSTQDKETENVCTVLFHPILSKKKRSNTDVEVEPVNLKECMKARSDALVLLRQARRTAGHWNDDTTLSHSEFGKALDSLKNVFEAEFMEKTDLKRKCALLDSGFKYTCSEGKNQAGKVRSISSLGDPSAGRLLLPEGSAAAWHLRCSQPQGFDSDHEERL